GWMTAMLRDTEINLATYPGYSIETTPSLLAEFDRNVRAARQALAAAKDADFTVVWSLKHGDRPHGPAAARCSAHAHQPSRSSSRAAQRVPPPERCAAPIDLRPDSR